MFRWIEKAMGSLAILVTGVVLTAAHFQHDAAQQASSTVLTLRVAYVGLPILAVIAALIALRFFRLTPERAVEVRRELELRRGKPHETAPPPPISSPAPDAAA